MNAARPHWWLVNIGSGNGLVPSGNKSQWVDYLLFLWTWIHSYWMAIHFSFAQIMIHVLNNDYAIQLRLSFYVWFNKSTKASVSNITKAVISLPVDARCNNNVFATWSCFDTILMLLLCTGTTRNMMVELWMMTSWHGNHFCITGPLRGESIPSQRPVIQNFFFVVDWTCCWTNMHGVCDLYHHGAHVTWL